MRAKSIRAIIPNMPMSEETRQRLRQVRDEAQRQKLDKVAAVRQARSEGASLREISEELNVAHRTVKNMLDATAKEAS